MRTQGSRIGVFGILLKVHQLVTNYGCTMICANDIIFQHPELIPKLPRDIILLDWGYDANALDEHGAKLAARAFYVCAGTSWNSLIGRTHNCLITCAARWPQRRDWLSTPIGATTARQYLPISYFWLAGPGCGVTKPIAGGFHRRAQHTFFAT